MRTALTAVALIGPASGALSNSLSGAYLAARIADREHDYAAAARYYTRALVMQRGNPELQEALTLAQLLRGNFDDALPIARAMDKAGVRSQVAQMMLATDLARSGDFEALIERSKGEERGIGPLVDGLVRAWAQLGAGRAEDAFATFDELSEQQGLKGFALYHKALALAQTGDFAGAEAIFSEDEQGLVQLTRRGAMARAEILSNLDRNQDALDRLDDAFGPASDPGIAALRERLEKGELVAFSHVNTAQDGLAEVYYSIAAALINEAQADYTLLYARMAQALRPDHSDALLLVADLLEDLGQYELAIDAFAQMPRDHVDYHAAELGRISALRKLSKDDAAIEALNNLAKTHGDLAVVYSTLGDVYRGQDEFALATDAYDKALARTDEAARNRWFLLYARAISLERQDMWDKAETDFRAALELEPDQPQVLNYLGYSMVEKQIKLDEALEMIERAVAARPDSGYIVDSLGWVLYRLGRYDEAVGHMELAVELMPVDPVVNDHLGDVYWAVGRYREAEFQWSRALSFIDGDNVDTEADPDRIRKKLEIGLDDLLAEEGKPPLKVAGDN
ncbi:tetratricopeptide repeat protein [Aliishimia ponticola]|uniref:Tetratricopeptide repeat protein n=2 Tax=Aliishimia ponticola TaxID=2499833 RepID=A0A4S4NFS5_9RHOB|nr:tetratricopeptide repeat protein [Aliishimia ponticola]